MNIRQIVPRHFKQSYLYRTVIENFDILTDELCIISERIYRYFNCYG